MTLHPLTEHLLALAPLPLPVQERLLSSSPAHLLALVENAHLDPSVRSTLLADPALRDDVLCSLLEAGWWDLPAVSEVHALRSRFEVRDGFLPLLDRLLSRVFHQDHVLEEALLEDVLAAGVLPETAASLMWRPDVDAATALLCAAAAPWVKRLAWLTGGPGAALSDEAAWSLAAVPGDDLFCRSELPRRDEDVVVSLVLLLYLRPALRSRALEVGGLPLLAAAHLPLAPSDQLLLLEEVSAHPERSPAAFMDGWRFDGYHRALELLLDAPWCVPQTFDRAAALASEHAGSGAVLATFTHPRCVERSRRRWSSLRGSSLAAVSSPWARRRLLRRGMLLELSPFALLELSRNPHLSSSQRLLLADRVAHQDNSVLGPLRRAAYENLSVGASRSTRERLAVRCSSRPPRLGRPPSRLALCPAKRAQPLRSLAPDELAGHGDLALPSAEHLAAASFLVPSLSSDPAVWEVALQLLDDGFEGRLADLVDLSRLLAARG